MTRLINESPAICFRLVAAVQLSRVNDQSAAVADDRDRLTNASYRSDSGPIKRLCSAEIKRRPNQKMMSQDLHKASVHEAFSASPDLKAVTSTSARIQLTSDCEADQGQSFRPIELRPAKAPPPIVRVATALYKAEFPTPHSTAYRPQAPTCNFQGHQRSSSEEATRCPALQ